MGIGELRGRDVSAVERKSELKEQARPAEKRTDAELFAKLKKFVEQISLPFVHKEEEAKLLALALITRENASFISEPGTAKTALAERAGDLADVKFFKKQLNRYTTPDEVIGPPDIKAIIEQGVFKSVTVKMAPESNLLLFDEMFRGGPAIRDYLLSLMNEHKYFNGQERLDAPIISVFGTTNFISYEDEDQAYYDRWLLRHFISPLTKEHWEKLMYATFDAEFKETTSVKGVTITGDELLSLYKMIPSVDTKKVIPELLTAFEKAEETLGIRITDRRKGKSLKMVAASALMNGRKYATVEDLEVLKYIIPRDEKERDQVVAMLNTIISPANRIDELSKMNANLQLEIDALRQDPNLQIDNIEIALETTAKAAETARKWMRFHSDKELRSRAKELLKNAKELTAILDLLKAQKAERAEFLTAVVRNGGQS